MFIFIALTQLLDALNVKQETSMLYKKLFFKKNEEMEIDFLGFFFLSGKFFFVAFSASSRIF